MAKVATKPKPTKAAPHSKAPAKRTSKAAAPASDDEAADTSPPPPAIYDKTFVLRLVLNKLEAVKSCDWHDLALRMGAKEEGPKRKGKKKKEEKVWSGTELHDIYHHSILPALKSGRALWADDANASDLYLPSPPPSVASPAKKSVSPMPVAAKEAAPAAVVEEEEEVVEEAEGLGDEVILGEEAEQDDDEEATVQGEVVAEDGEAEEEAAETIQAEAEAAQDEVVAGENRAAAVAEAEGEGEAEGEEEAAVEEVKKPSKKAGKKAADEGFEEKPIRRLPKLATTYGKKSAPVKKTTTTPPSQSKLAYRQAVLGKAGQNGNKRTRPAYSDDEDEVRIEIPTKGKKTTPPSSGRGGGRRATKAAKYQDSDSEAEEDLE